VDDPYGLRRFELAQEHHDVYASAVSELRAGRKLSHWMWFVFPQLAGLGRSATSRAYAISSLEEATAYLSHPLLGPRLHECARILTQLRGLSAHAIFGSVDAQKLHSSMSLFASVAPGDGLFQDVLQQYFGGIKDAQTDSLLAAAARRPPDGRR
jgi:uncharacterized protein (DUF1810 family)